MGINKVQYGNTVLIDLTDATATADKILQGYTAYGADGSKLTGTATGGGGGSVTQDQDGFIVLPPDGGSSPSGGLEYEMGTWTPSEDVAGSNVTIAFSNTHTSLPFFVNLVDVGDDYYDTLQTDFAFTYYCYYSAVGGMVRSSATSTRYGEVRNVYRAGTATSTTLATNNLQYPPTDTGSSTSSYPRWFVTESGFHPRGSAYWRTGRTYKWIAVWAPTT